MPSIDPAQNTLGSLAAARALEAAAERTLVAAVQEGDLDAFRELHGRHLVDLLDFAFTYLRSREDAEEVVQDLFLWIWERRHEWAPLGGVRAYLFAATRNRAISRLRQRRVQTRFAERLGWGDLSRSPVQTATGDALGELTAGELERVLARCLEALPPRPQEVFRLIRERNLSYADVAKLLGISPKTVEIHMSHALGALRRAVEEWRQSER